MPSVKHGEREQNSQPTESRDNLSRESHLRPLKIDFKYIKNIVSLSNLKDANMFMFKKG